MFKRAIRNSPVAILAKEPDCRERAGKGLRSYRRVLKQPFKEMHISLLTAAFLITSALIPSGLNALPAKSLVQQDTLKESQMLYNGRLWRDLYSRIDGDQFLFSSDFIPGSVAMEGRIYTGVPLAYDIFKDELITQTRHGLALQLNKEMVDSFSLSFNGKDYFFERTDSTREYSGFMNVLYNGRSSFMLKYKKNIELLAVDKRLDQFYQVHRMYLVRDNSVDQFSGKLEFMKLLGDHKKMVRSYMKKNRINAVKSNPESFIPLIEYYDQIR